MRHSIVVTGPAFRIRPIADEDASLVIELRGNPQLGKYLHAISNRLDDQLKWFANYYERPGDYYFVIERKDSGAAEGVISIYDILLASRCGEWGRWVVRPGSLSAIESCWLIYRCAFECLGLEEVYCRTVADNERVLCFHDSCGISSRRILPAHFQLNDQKVDAVEHRMSRSEWERIGPRLGALSESIARRFRHA